MRVLWIVTKPPWPPIDGGRLATVLTVEALAAAGAEVTVLAPEVEPRQDAPPRIELRTVVGRPTPWALAAPRAWLSGGSATLERHRVVALARAAGREIAARPPWVVHVEQLQALAQAAPALARGLPVVLRAQNVESDLWRGAAELASGWRARWLTAEAARLARDEGLAVRRVTTTLALSREDAARLEDLAGARAKVTTLAVPFPAELPAGEALPGAPTVVLLGSGGWLPNRAGAVWFLEQVWPRVVACYPGAQLQVFGEVPTSGPNVTVRPAPTDSSEAFPRGGILAVPLHVASGVRMKILEAWARGLPVVATPQAASGLEAHDGRHLLQASDPADFARAIGSLVAEPNRVQALVTAGRALLATHHDPARIAARLLEIYGEAAVAAHSRDMNSS